MMHIHKRIYEVNTLVWLNSLSKREGEKMTLSDVPEGEIERLKSLGFDYIWLMGVWKRSAYGRKVFLEGDEIEKNRQALDAALQGWTEADIAGSPYSIAAYEPDPEIGTWDCLLRFKSRLNNLGIGLILDFVPNHTAPDHPWVMSNPDYYLQGTEEEFRSNPTHFVPIENNGKTHYFACGKDPHFPPWRDTLQLNYFNLMTRQSLIEEAKKISRYCDGLRCDMAMLVLNDIFQNTWGYLKEKNVHEGIEIEFWKMLRYTLPKHTLIAEAYWDTEWTLQQLGFDYVYDKRLYDRLIYAGPRDILLHLNSSHEFQSKLVRFLENHDELPVASILEKRRHLAAAVLISTVPGLKLYHHGQIEGWKIKIPIQLRRTNKQPIDLELKDFYEKLLKITHMDVFRDSEWILIRNDCFNSHCQVISYLWRFEDRYVLVIINYTSDDFRGTINLETFTGSRGPYTCHDLFGEGIYNINNNNIEISLSGYGFKIILLN